SPSVTALEIRAASSSLDVMVWSELTSTFMVVFPEVWRPAARPDTAAASRPPLRGVATSVPARREDWASDALDAGGAARLDTSRCCSSELACRHAPGRKLAGRTIVP